MGWSPKDRRVYLAIKMLFLEIKRHIFDAENAKYPEEKREAQREELRRKIRAMKERK